jgi:outer membrane scaffolding protein for murein synthesis (MipA/OmpV family)
MKNRVVISLFLFSIFYSHTTLAAPAPIITSTQERVDRPDNAFGIGMSISIAERPFIGVDKQNTNLLYLSYKYKNFYIEGLDTAYSFYKKDGVRIELLGTPRFYEVEPAFADNGELDGIGITEPSYFGGLSAQLKAGPFIYTLQLLHDLIESDGNEAVLQLSKPFHVSDTLTLTGSLGLTYQDKELVGYYYGVQANEVMTGRPQYDGKSSLNYNFTLNASWLATRHIELLGQVKYDLLGDGITDSPIVDDDSLISYTFGIVYRFK